ncbi:O-Glycosyl hydrolases family 17 protein [Artemisia annua]|uniref:O-Glycosyl hydrolases family 17 protein n=1 Tax=Artemisia annua TaxID=35608 RepID=A0A2U1P993_ARTAN|nr:O-Glycosyl hydrolases family 17 protein [Artemisia annua]
MKVLHAALVKNGISGVKVSSPHSLGILEQSVPPSNATFRKGWDVGNLKPMLEFLKKTNAGFMVNPYTYFGWSPANENYCLFKPNGGMLDKATGKRYTNQFDQLMDAVHVSMEKLGYPDVEIIVAETGWPSGGDPQNKHANPANAAAYNGGLIKKVTSGVGTPLMPGRKFETYIFSLFNENLKGPSLDEKNFGLFRPDFTQVYNIGILTGSQAPSPSPMLAPEPSPSPMLAPEPFPSPILAPSYAPVPSIQPPAGVNNTTSGRGSSPTPSLASSNDVFALNNGGDCRPIQAGGACFEPNNVRSHAAFIMNAFYQTNGRNDFNCDFAHTGVITSTDPRFDLKMAARVVELMNMVMENVRTLRGHETNNDNGLRGENDSRANEEGIIVIRTRSVLSLIILLLLLGYVIFMYIGFYILDKSHPYFKTVDVQHMHANFNIHNNDTVSLEEVRVSLRVNFGDTNKVKVYPEFGTYTIIKNVDNSHTIRAFSHAPYQISENEQLLLVKFKPSQIRLQKEQLKAFQQRLDEGLIWMRINGDFKMQLRLARFITFPHTTRHIHFVCNVQFKAAPLDEIVDKRCETFDEPQQ